MKESHTLDENEHHRTALAAAEKDLEHMREEVRKHKEEAAALRAEVYRSHEEAEVMKAETAQHQRRVAELEEEAKVTPSDEGGEGVRKTEPASPTRPIGENLAAHSRSAVSTGTLNTSFASPASLAVSEVTGTCGPGPSSPTLLMAGTPLGGRLRVEHCAQ